MNIEEITEIIAPLRRMLEAGSRINLAKPQKYWYPLSLATYGVEEIVEAIDSMCSFRTSMWEKTVAFEAQFSRYIGCGEAVMVNSGSSANLLLAFSLRHPAKPTLQIGDEVLVPAVTWPTHIWPVLMAGFRPVIVDVDPDTLNIDLSKAEESVGPRTRALFIAHILGNPCDMDKVVALCKRHDLLLLEDACEALGASYKGRRVGAWGWGGSFSFFFSHHMTTMEGGMVACDDPGLADQIRTLRAHGWIRDLRHTKHQYIEDGEEDDLRYTFTNWGFNVRPTEVQAGFGLRQLERLPVFEQRREQLAEAFRTFLTPWNHWIDMPKPCPGGKPSWLGLAMMLTPDAPFTRRQITSFLEQNGVETRPIVTGNLCRQPVMQYFPGLVRGELDGANAIHARGFYIGLSPMQDDAAMDRLKETFVGFLKSF